MLAVLPNLSGPVTVYCHWVTVHILIFVEKEGLIDTFTWTEFVKRVRFKSRSEQTWVRRINMQGHDQANLLPVRSSALRLSSTNSCNNSMSACVWQEMCRSV